MISDEDIDFHRISDDPLWCETNWWTFAIPEKNISGGFYVINRPNIGVSACDVTIQDRISSRAEDQLYIDNQRYLSCPESLRKYKLSNGFGVEVVDPFRLYRLSYVGHSDTNIELEFRSLMTPFDMNDAKHDPFAGQLTNHGWGKALSGHCEIAGHVTGKARIKGVDYEVDCIGAADRSWGVRKEVDFINGSWMHGHFGEGFHFHVMTALDPANSLDYGKAITGYIFDEGRLHGLTEIKGSYTLDGVVTTSATLDLTDVRGRKFRFEGKAVSGTPWSPTANTVYPQSFMTWRCGEREGYGVLQHGYSYKYLNENRAQMFGAPA